MIGIPALNLAMDSETDKFVLPAIIKKITDNDYICQIVFGLQNQYDSSLNFKVIKIFKEDEFRFENLEGGSLSIHSSQLVEESIFATLEK